ncbi:caspase family protein [Sphingomonas sp. LT1P40]|uniref:caspase family protein n=1 Tax=Alteristakelama amylovorans TaxID=3096166 RepID=UPI002FC933BF
MMLKRLALAVMAIGLTGAAMPPEPAPAPVAQGRIRAVIVAVAAYKDGIASPLIGTYNDAVLIADTLIRSGAKREDITLLADKPTPELMRGLRQRPTTLQIDALATRDNILGALKKAALDTRAGDEVLLSFSGHGVQQVEAVAGSEPDGRDEVFLPFDTGAPDASFSKVQNAVLDDEIGAAIDAIRSKGGNVTFIADFCHSGDSSRDANAPPPQPIEAKLKLPARKYVAISDAGFVRDLAGETKKGQTGWGAYVGMMAAPSAVQARQDMAPAFADRAEQAPHGLLTVYAMANWNNPRVYSYRDLANRITAGTDKHAKAPRPEFDGDIDRPLLGGLMKVSAGTSSGGSWAVFKPVTKIASTKDPVKIESLEMGAGQLQGLVEGTIVALALATPTGDKTILYGRVDKADAYRAVLVPTSYGEIPAETWNDVKDIDGKSLSREVRLIATIEQQPVQLDYRIALPAAPSSPTAAQTAALAALQKIKPADIGATFVQAGQEADLILAFDKAKPDMLTMMQPPGRVTAAFGGIDLAAAMAAGGSSPDIRVQFTVGGALVKATRFNRLQRVLASPGLATGDQSENPAKDVSVEFYVGRPKALATGAKCPDTSADYYAVDKGARRIGGDGSEAGSFTFQRCDWLFIKVTNTGKSDVYVNPLIFSPDGGILLFDGQDKRLGIKADNPTRLRAGESGVLQYMLSDAQAGAQLRDDFVLLVSDVTDGVPLSYARLIQCPVVSGPEDGPACAAASDPTLAGTRMRDRTGPGTGIEDLIDAALVGSTTRSGPPKKPTSVGALRFSWQTEAR